MIIKEGTAGMPGWRPGMAVARLDAVQMWSN